METLSNCPICNQTSLSHWLTCKDFTVTQKQFNIVSCDKCGFKFTNPRPNKTELGFYYKADEYISHTDTKKGIINRLYHLVRKYTLLKKLQLVVRLTGGLSNKKNISILDIGCGTGAFLDVCNKTGFKCEGIEPDPDARLLAKSNYNLDIKDESQLSTLEADSFDIITLWHVLEHVSDLNERIAQIKSLLNSAGRVIVAVPNCSSYDAKHYGAFWAAYDVPRHLYHFTPKDISLLFEKHGMKMCEILPMTFDSYYVSMLSEKYKSGSTNYFKSLWIGFRSNLSAIKNKNTFSSQIYIIKKV